MIQSLIHKRKNSNIPKSKRITVLEEAQQIAKKKNMPDPGHYTVVQKDRVTGAFNLKDAKVSFIDDARWVGN